MTDVKIVDGQGRTVIVPLPVTLSEAAAPQPEPIPPTPEPVPPTPLPEPTPTPLPEPTPPPTPGKWPVPDAYSSLPQLDDYDFHDPFPPLTGNAEAKIGLWTIQPREAVQSTDPSEPISPPSVLQMNYKKGFRSGEAPSNAWLVLPGGMKKELYFGFTWRCSAPWQGEPSNVNKILFLYMAGTRQAVIPVMYGPVNGPFRLRTNISELGIPQVRPWCETNKSAAPIVPGQWCKFEIYCLVRPGQTGILRILQNDKLVTEYNDIAYDPKGFDSVSLNPTWGGNENATKQRDEWCRYGHAHTRGR